MLRISSILVGLPSATIRCRLSVLSVMRGGRSLMLLQEEHMHTAVGSCACPPIVLIRVTGVATCNRQPGSQVCRLFREFWICLKLTIHFLRGDAGVCRGSCLTAINARKVVLPLYCNSQVVLLPEAEPGMIAISALHFSVTPSLQVHTILIRTINPLLALLNQVAKSCYPYRVFVTNGPSNVTVTI